MLSKLIVFFIFIILALLHAENSWPHEVGTVEDEAFNTLLEKDG